MDELARIGFAGRGCTVCTVAAGLSLKPGEACIVATNDGLDAGTYLGPAPSACCGADEAAGDSHEASGQQKTPKVVRRVNAQDRARLDENAVLAEKTLLSFVELLRAENVFIKPLTACFTLGRERLLIIFGAPEHVECRKAVGKLQWDLETRIEVRHVGVRDEAAVAGGIGSCGRALCCASWMRTFRSVNVRMARMQELSLNPMAINGCCGRLKCCLRYEYGVYQEAGKSLPPDGTRVQWDDQEGIVVGRDVLRQRLLVRTCEQGMQHVAAADVRVVGAVEPAPNDAKGEQA